MHERTERGSGYAAPERHGRVAELDRWPEAGRAAAPASSDGVIRRQVAHPWLPAVTTRVPLAKHEMLDEDKRAVTAVLDGDLLSHGPRLAELEALMAERAQRRYAIAVNSGTSALHLIVKALEIQRGDEVITTSFSFIASANCLLYEGVTPRFVDVDPATGNIDPEQVRRQITPGTRAILAVDVFGLPADWEELEAIGCEFGVALVEDSCEALGSRLNGRPAGSFGKAAAFSFFPNKQVIAGEGGMIVTDDDAVARICASYRDQGRNRELSWLEHERLGYNYRMDEMSGALALAQLRRLDSIVTRRQAIARRYSALLGEVDGVTVPSTPSGVDVSWFGYVVRLPRGVDRGGIMEYLMRCGVQTRNYHTPIHLQPFYRSEYGYSPGMLPVTEDLAARSLALPFFNGMSTEQQEYVVACLAEALAVAGYHD